MKKFVQHYILSGRACIQEVLCNVKDHPFSNLPWSVAAEKISMRMPSVHRWTQNEKGHLELESSFLHYQKQLGCKSSYALNYCGFFRQRGQHY